MGPCDYSGAGRLDAASGDRAHAPGWGPVTRIRQAKYKGLRYLIKCFILFPVDASTLRGIVNRLLDQAMKKLQKTGNIDVLIACLKEYDGELVAVKLPIPQDVLNEAMCSARAKDIVFKAQAVLARESGADATLTLADAWTTDMTQAGKERVEAIIAIAQTRLLHFGIVQIYYREKSRIRFGAREEFGTHMEVAAISGRVVEAFPSPHRA